MYCHLHGHSTYSFLEAIGSIKDILTRVKELGMSSVGIVDYRGMYGCFDFYKQSKSFGINPLIGVEMPFVRDKSLVLKRDQRFGTLCFLAKNYHGYQQLLRLVSQAHADKRFGVPYFDLSVLSDLEQDDLYVFFGGIHSFVGQLLLAGHSENQVLEQVGGLVSCFGKDTILGEIVVQDHSIVHGLSDINDFVLHCSQHFGFRCFVDNNFHYVSPEEKEAYELALCIKDGKKIYDDDRRKVIGAYHIMSEDEILGLATKNGFDQDVLVSWMETTLGIAESISIDIPMGETLFPHYKTPTYIENLYKKHHQSLFVS